MNNMPSFKVTQARPGDVMRHHVHKTHVDVTRVIGNWVEFVDRDGPALRYLEEDVFVSAYRFVRNAPVILKGWEDKRVVMLAEAHAQGLAVPPEFNA